MMRSLPKGPAVQHSPKRMAAVGITAEQLMPKGKQRRIKSSDRAGKKSNAVYRNPASAATWGGLGRRPAWVVQWLEQGRRLDELAI
jgi:DNA-binding protein H-NS